MTKMDRSQRDQKIIYDALMRVAGRMNSDGRDPVHFPILSLSATSMMIAEIASHGTKLYEPLGAEEIIAFMATEFARMLREDIAAKLAEQGRETRQ